MHCAGIGTIRSDEGKLVCKYSRLPGRDLLDLRSVVMFYEISLRCGGTVPSRVEVCLLACIVLPIKLLWYYERVVVDTSTIR